VSSALLRRVLLAGLLVLGILLATVTRQSAPTLPGEFAASIAPIFGFSFRLGQNARASLAAIFDRRDLRAEQRRMQAELQQLRQENQRLILENRRLQATLRVQAVQGLGVVAVAPVIDDDPSGLYRRLFLGAGSSQGLRVGMPVTTANGLVGVITEVTPNQAVVRTILDPESRVGVRLASAPGRLPMVHHPECYGLKLHRRPTSSPAIRWFQVLYRGFILLGLRWALSSRCFR